MKISHVIRGDDHLNNTPRQAQLYAAFDYPLPQFAHLPMILGPDKKRLSKRYAATSVLSYRNQGYLPEAMLNFLARLGWSHGDQEIFSVEELIEKFSMEQVGKAAGVFNEEKLVWTNFEHMRVLSNKELLERTKPFFEDKGIELKIDDYAERAIESVKEKEKTLKELAEYAAFYFYDEVPFDKQAAAKFLTDENKTMLAELMSALQKLDPFSEENVQTTIEKFLEEKQLKLKTLAQPLRVALTGSTRSPGIYETLAILGKERVIKRLNHI
jgi:glutamyl-tRNA synthetase